MSGVLPTKPRLSLTWVPHGKTEAGRDVVAHSEPASAWTQVGLLLALVGIGPCCSGTSGSGSPAAHQPASTPESPSQAATGAPEAEAAPSSATCSPQHMRACFGPMVLLAGRAQIGRKGQDGWTPRYEGGPGVEAELSRPHFAMADHRGNIYIADKDAHAVRKLTPEGSIVTVVAHPDVEAPNGLWVGSTGVVYILNLRRSKIDRLDPEGATTTLFEVPGGISIGRGLWVRDDETLAYVASNTKVLRWTPEAGVQDHASGFRSLGNLVIDPEGALVVTDRAGGRVYRLDAGGARTPIAGNGKGSGGGDGSPALMTALPGVRAVWFDRSGGYFLGTHEGSAVWFVDPEGIIHRFLAQPQVDEVRGLSMDGQGNLIIVDDDRGRVWRLMRTQ